MDEITVCYSVNKSFFQHLYVSVASLRHHAVTKHRVFVLYDDASPSDLESLSGLNDDLLFIIPLKISPDDLKNVKTHGRFNISHFYRLFIPYLLPEEIERAIYLDADIILNGPLDDLFHVDLDDNPLAAVQNADYTDVTRLGLPEDAPYFNSGVMVMDLPAWREQNITQKVIAFAEKNPEKLAFVDQCALNAELAGRWKQLSPVWNFQELFSWMTKDQFQPYVEAVPYPDDRTEPVIIHFTGPEKPWHYKSNHPWKAEYEKYLSQSPWADYIPPDYTPVNRVKKFILLNFPGLHRFLHKMRK